MFSICHLIVIDINSIKCSKSYVIRFRWMSAIFFAPMNKNTPCFCLRLRQKESRLEKKSTLPTVLRKKCLFSWNNKAPYEYKYFSSNTGSSADEIANQSALRDLSPDLLSKYVAHELLLWGRHDRILKYRYISKGRVSLRWSLAGRFTCVRIQLKTGQPDEYQEHGWAPTFGALRVQTGLW